MDEDYTTGSAGNKKFALDEEICISLEKVKRLGRGDTCELEDSHKRVLHGVSRNWEQYSADVS